MTLATTPTSAITTTPRFSAIAERRWDYWHGPVALWIALDGRPRSLDAIKLEHSLHLAWLLAQGVQMRVVRRLNLDDPREPRLLLRARAELYLSNNGRSAKK
jgi:hypothetical protein